MLTSSSPTSISEMHLSYNTKEKLKEVVKLSVFAVIVYVYFQWPFYKFLPSIEWFFWVWVVGLFCLIGIFPVLAMRLKNLIQGEEAEEDVADILESLPASFLYFPNLILGERGNIDNAVVGPAGIWAIEVKSHSGKITFDGNELRRDGELFEEKDFFKQAWAEAYAFRDFLKQKVNHEFLVQPVIVFDSLDTELHFGFNKIKGVYVIHADWLRRLILNTFLERLETSLIEQVADVLKDKQE